MRNGAHRLGGLALAALFGGLVAALLAAAAGTATGQTTTYPTPGATPAAADLIAGFEGFCAHPYNDTQSNCGTGGNSGNCTIGFGTLLHSGPCTADDRSTYTNGIDRQQGLNMLQNDANAAAAAVDRYVTVPLTPAQRDALTSFVYNTGVGAFQGSTLLRDLNSGDTQGAADQMLRWINANGQRNQGLLNRRNAERCYFLQGTTACGAQIRRGLARTALAHVTVTVTVTATVAAARPGHARLRLLTHHARSGAKVRFKGTGWARGPVKIVAYVPGVSPYRLVRLRATADGHGQFLLTWRVSPKIADKLNWRLTATQGRRLASARVVIATG